MRSDPIERTRRGIGPDRAIAVWCPVCGEAAYLDDDEMGVAKDLAQNHDENYHDGARQTFVSRRRSAVNR